MACAPLARVCAASWRPLFCLCPGLRPPRSTSPDHNTAPRGVRAGAAQKEPDDQHRAAFGVASCAKGLGAHLVASKADIKLQLLLALVRHKLSHQRLEFEHCEPSTQDQSRSDGLAGGVGQDHLRAPMLRVFWQTRPSRSAESTSAGAAAPELGALPGATSLTGSPFAVLHSEQPSAPSRGLAAAQPEARAGSHLAATPLAVASSSGAGDVTERACNGNAFTCSGSSVAEGGGAILHSTPRFPVVPTCRCPKLPLSSG